MKLTVGSLPSAVYWRRRAIVLVVGLLGASVIWVSCTGSDDSGKSGKAQHTSGNQASPPSSPPASYTLLSPPATSPPVGSPGASATEVQAAGGFDSTPVCSDSEMQVIPVPEATTVQRGHPIRLTLRATNLANRSCPRDIGADAQEVYLLADGARLDATKVYSSDACEPRHGTQVKVFSPGLEITGYVEWDGTATSAGCAGRQPPPAGKYQLIGRLGTKTSDPVIITLT